MRWHAALTLGFFGACADARDLFRPYQPDEWEIREVLAQRWPAPKMDVALALGCPAEPDGRPSLCERCRVKSAVRLYKQGRVGKILFTGGAAHSAHVEADVMGALAESRGVPKQDVLREGRAMTTWQNYRFSLQMIREAGLNTVLVVSTSDHMPRARRMARYYGLPDERTAFFACDLDAPHDGESPLDHAPTIH